MEIHPVDLDISKTLLLVCNISSLVLMIVNVLFNYRDPSDPQKREKKNDKKPKSFLKYYSYSIVILLVAIFISAILISDLFRIVYSMPFYVISICVLISSLYKKRDESLNFTETAVLGLLFSILSNFANDLLMNNYVITTQALNEFLQLMAIALRFFVFGFIIIASSVLSIKIVIERFKVFASSITSLPEKITIHTEKMKTALLEKRIPLRILKIPIAVLIDIGLSIVLLVRYIVFTLVNPIIIVYSVIIRPIINWLRMANDKRILRAIFFFSMIISLCIVYIFTQTIYPVDSHTENIYSFIASVISIPYLASMIISRKSKHDKQETELKS